MARKCPKCGGEEFAVTAHVTQNWQVDGDGTIIDVTCDCVDVTHRPDDSDLWECCNCGYAAEGSKFSYEKPTALVAVCHMCGKSNWLSREDGTFLCTNCGAVSLPEEMVLKSPS